PPRADDARFAIGTRSRARHRPAPPQDPVDHVWEPRRRGGWGARRAARCGRRQNRRRRSCVFRQPAVALTVPISVADIFISMIVLLFSLTVHEMAHAWSADRLGDPTARLLGRVSLNPIVHADPIGTILFPLISLISGAVLIGWAKPVPVNLRYLRHPRRDYMLVAAAGPASNLVLALFAAILLAILPITPQTLGEQTLA